jgi:hypothetical protein
MEPRAVAGIPPVYRVYRDTPIGRSLQEVLAELRELRMVRPEQETLLLETFDRAMAQHRYQRRVFNSARNHS